ncbi:MULTISPECIES: rhodanese-like domain-containing protein [unclassified Delftia]|uniref:rhodanese-like domain-containing protein n=1 Tax=unclassified Delftia TaxID=2613839 RepID=UPI0018FF6E97|nr:MULTISPECIES: rhodanese-like domain-containing protein [unclassified Delftia]MBK0114750.1 VTT domain-containing protein [Delftia sp. S65]MBK0120318.1 VTT domain-containing protein [Delftia sp. S67]MBK0132827.1 VTT domain-containing protein [Delftia sp. S66]
MGFLVELIREYGFGIVFLNVFVEQLGAPIPAYPVLVVTGALEGADWVRLLWLVAVAVSAALIADLFWYQAGKAYGHRVLGRICRISLSPDACIRQTETVYGRWGARSLLVAKFVPGFASIASALAGVMGTPLRSFVLYDGLGALIWVGSAVYLGSLFSSTVEDLLGVLTALGQWGLLLLGVALGLFIVRKWWQRHRMVRSLRMPRMSVRELAGLHAQGMEPTVIDVRALPQYRQGHIPGAQSWELRPRDGGESHAHLLPQHDHPHGLVIYCDCPNEISAARLARQLQRAGFANVRPLVGGLKAWQAAGFDVETAPLPVTANADEGPAPSVP